MRHFSLHLNAMMMMIVWGRREREEGGGGKWGGKGLSEKEVSEVVMREVGHKSLILSWNHLSG